MKVILSCSFSMRGTMLGDSQMRSIRYLTCSSMHICRGLFFIFYFIRSSLFYFFTYLIFYFYSNEDVFNECISHICKKGVMEELIKTDEWTKMATQTHVEFMHKVYCVYFKISS